MGATIITTVTDPAPNYNLTDLATVHDELSIPTTDTTNDAFLNRAIAQASKVISNYCNRKFQVEGIQDLVYIEQDPYPYQVPGGIYPLQLSKYPLLSVSSVVQTIAIDTTQALVDGTDYKVDAANGWLIRLNPFTGVATKWEALPVTVSYVGGYGANDDQATSVPGTGPYQVTVTRAASFSVDRGVSYTGGAALTKVTGAPAAGQYSVDPATGIYTFAAADAGAAVTISYSYNQIPDDLVDATLRLVTQRFKQKNRDPMLMSQTQPNLGEQRWWVGATPGQNGALPPEIAGLLDGTYRVPVAI